MRIAYNRRIVGAVVFFICFLGWSQEKPNELLQYRDTLLINQKAIEKELVRIDSLLVYSIEKYGYDCVLEKSVTVYKGSVGNDFKGTFSKGKTVHIVRIEGAYFKTTEGYIHIYDTPYPLNLLKSKKQYKTDLFYKGSAGSSTKSTSSKCKAVQCSGTTKAGRRCRNTTTKCSGRCYLH